MSDLSPTRRQEFFSLDQNEAVSGLLARPERYRELESWLSSKSSVIPRGSGLSYALCSAGNNVVSLWTSKFNRILQFNPISRTIRVESGIGIGELLLFLKAQGFWFPVIPGHPDISLGGCLACNIHGKSQFHQGNFIDHVERFLLIDSSGSCISCSRDENQELFELSAGAFGLTGFIVELTLRIQPLQGRCFIRTRLQARDLLESAALMLAHKDTFEYIYSWNNLNVAGNHFGKGFVYLEAFSSESKIEKFQIKHINNPPMGFAAKLNGKGSFAVSLAYKYLETLKPETMKLGLLTGSFLFNGKDLYFRIFGRQGFREYQCIIPHSNWSEFVKKLTILRRQSKIDVTLGSLKIFQGKGKYLYFKGDGICLALDVPATKEALFFFAGLDQLVGSLGGIVNISKDSRLRADFISKLFPEYKKFKELISSCSPAEKFTSALRERMDV